MVMGVDQPGECEGAVEGQGGFRRLGWAVVGAGDLAGWGLAGGDFACRKDRYDLSVCDPDILCPVFARDTQVIKPHLSFLGEGRK